MVITFPNMGNVSIAAQTLFQGLQIPYVTPEKNNQQTLKTGSYYSPEEICLPYKIMLGNLIESIERGADTVIMPGSCGPCRLGEYCELQMKILKKLGYQNIDFVVADLSHEIGISEFKQRLGKISAASPVSLSEKITALKTAYKVEDLCDKIDAEAHYLAGFEARKGACARIKNESKAKALQSMSPQETVKLLEYYKKKLEGVKIDREKDPLKIAIIGEIYTVIEPFSNFNIEDRLMECGVSTKRMLTPSWWVRDLLLKPMKLNSREINRAAKEYLSYPIGGHGVECIGEAVLAKKHGMDGVIQVFPLGCMPEVIAKSILPTIKVEKDIPIMTMIVDEVSGEAGYITRIEAFLDMLKSRKRKSRTAALSRSPQAV